MRQAPRLMRVFVLGAVVAGVLVPLSSANAAPKPSAASIKQQIATASNQLEIIVEQYDKVNTLLHTNQAAEKKVQAQIAPTLKLAQAAQADVSRIAAQAYMSGPTNTLSVLVNAGNTDDLLNQLTALNEVASSRKQQIAGANKVMSQYNAQKLKLDSLITVENAQRKNLVTQKATINAKLTKLYAMRVAAYGSATTSSSANQPIPPYIPGRGGVVVAFAYKQLGKPYVWAADGPGSYDCSGLALAAYRQVNISLPHNTSMQWGVVHHIPRAELSPGVLIFYDSSNIHHVAIYIGGGKVIHAPTFGERVKISGMDMMHPWGYGRP